MYNNTMEDEVSDIKREIKKAGLIRLSGSQGINWLVTISHPSSLIRQI